MSELIVIQPENALSVFSENGKLDPLLESIAKEVRAFVPDVSTVSGRKEIASVAYKVAQSKTYLDSIGKSLVDEYKEIPKKIDANRKAVRDFLDNLRDEVRKPLNDYEAEQARIESERVAAIEAEALRIKAEADHEFALLMNAAFDAEQKEKRRADEQRRAEREQEIARAAAAAERERAERQIIEAKLAQERAEQNAKDAEARAEQSALEAVNRERQRADAEARAIADEQAKRFADLEHRKAINCAAALAIQKCGVDESTARAIIVAIAKGEVQNVSIIY